MALEADDAPRLQQDSTAPLTPNLGPNVGPSTPVDISPFSLGLPAPASLFEDDEPSPYTNVGSNEDLYGLGLPGETGMRGNVTVGGPGLGLHVGDPIVDMTARDSGRGQIVHQVITNRPGRGLRPLRPSEPVSISRVRDQWFQMSQSARAQWQQRMYEAGFLADEPMVWGLPNPDQSDYRAWITTATYSARMGVSMDDLLTQAARGRIDEGEQGPRRPDITLTSSADARRIAEEIGKELIGKTPSKEQIDKAVARLHSIERAAGSAAADAAMNEAGGAVMEGAPSPSTAIEDSLEAQMPEEVRAHDTAGAFANFVSMLGGQ